MGSRLVATVGDYAEVWEADGVEDVPMCSGGRRHNLYEDPESPGGINSLVCPCGGWRRDVEEVGHGA